MTTRRAVLMLWVLAGCSRGFTAPTSGPSAVTFHVAIISGMGQSGPVDEVLLQPLVVEVDTLGGSPVAGTGVVFSVAAGGGSVDQGSVQTGPDGRALVHFTLGAAPGNNEVTASAGGSGVTFNATGLAGAAVGLTLASGDAQTGTAGSDAGLPLSVRALDELQNGVPGVLVTFAVESGTGTLAPTTAITDASGIARSALIPGAATGAVRVEAGAAGLPPVFFSLTVAPGAPATLVVSSGGDQTAIVSQRFGQAVVVQVQDALGNGVPQVPVSASMGADGLVASVSFSSTPVSTDATGSAPFVVTAGGTAGPALAMFSADGVPSLGVPLSITSGRAASIAAVGPTTFTGVAGTEVQMPDGGATSLRVLVTDQEGNPVAGMPVSFATADPGANVSPVVVTAGDGTAASSWLLGSKAGAQQVLAILQPGSQITFTATVSAGPLAALAKFSGDLGTGAVCGSLAFAVRATDLFANPIAGVPVTWTGPSTAACANGGAATQVVPTDATGLAQATVALGSISGEQGITANTPGLGPVNFAATAVPGLPFTILGLNETQGEVGDPLPADALAIRVYDRYSNIAAGQPVQVNVLQGGGHLGSIQSDGGGSAQGKVIADGAGRVDLAWTLGTQTGINILQVTSPDAGATPLTAYAFSTPGPAAQLVKASPDQTGAATPPVTAGYAPLAVEVLDQYDNPATTANQLVSFGTTDPCVALSAPGAFSSATGLASTPVSVTCNTGTTNLHTVTASAANLTNSPVTFTLEYDATPPGLTPSAVGVGARPTTITYQLPASLAASGATHLAINGTPRITNLGAGGVLSTVLTAADATQAGELTVAVIGTDGGVLASDTLSVLARPPFPPSQLTCANSERTPTSLQAIDLDGDGTLDLVGTGFVLRNAASYDPNPLTDLDCPENTWLAQVVTAAIGDAGPTALGFWPDFEIPGLNAYASMGGNWCSLPGPGAGSTACDFPATPNFASFALGSFTGAAVIDVLGSGPQIVASGSGGCGYEITVIVATGVGPDVGDLLDGGGCEAGLTPFATPTVNYLEGSLSPGPPVPDPTAVGDFNGDGVADAVFAHQGNLYTVLSAGGTGQPSVVTTVLPVPAMAMVAGHFAGTGTRLDLATVNTSGALQLWANDGSGGFTSVGAAFASPALAWALPSLASGHDDGGALDALVVLAPAPYFPDGGGSTGTLWSLAPVATGWAVVEEAIQPAVAPYTFGVPSGSPVTYTQLPTGGPQALVLADLNGDGKLDLELTVGSGTPFSSGATSLGHAGGPGSREGAKDLLTSDSVLPEFLPTGASVVLPTTHISAATSGSAITASPLIVPGLGGGRFAFGRVDSPYPVSPPPAFFSGSFYGVDLNGDGYTDVLQSTAGTNYVALADGDGGFLAGQTYPFAPAGADGGPYLVVAPATDGGRPTLLAYGGSLATLDVIPVSAEGALGTPLPAQGTLPFSEGGILAAAPAHFDASGRLGAVVLQSGPLGLLAGALGETDGGPGQLTVLGQVSVPGSAGLSNLVDVDGDGFPDVLFMDAEGVKVAFLGPDPDHGVAVQQAELLSTSSPPVEPAFDDPAYLTVVDVNGDGKPDVVWISSSTAVQNLGAPMLNLLLNQGNRVFTSRVIDDGLPSSAPPYPIGDINGDGTCDFAFPAYSATNQSIAVLLMGPDGHVLSQSFSVAAPFEGTLSGIVGAANAYGSTGHDLLYVSSSSNQVGTLRATRF